MTTLLQTARNARKTALAAVRNAKAIPKTADLAFGIAREAHIAAQAAYEALNGSAGDVSLTIAATCSWDSLQAMIQISRIVLRNRGVKRTVAKGDLQAAITASQNGVSDVFSALVAWDDISNWSSQIILPFEAGQTAARARDTVQAVAMAMVKTYAA